MKRMMFSDLDGTLLESGVLSQDNKESLRSIKNKGVDVVVATGKGYNRVNPYLKEHISDTMILENGSKIFKNGEFNESNIQGQNLIKFLNLISKISELVDYLFFYDSNNSNQAYFYVGGTGQLDDASSDKFSNIIREDNVFHINELFSRLMQGLHNASLFNIKIAKADLESHGIKEYEEDFHIVFNEGMLNISLKTKGDAMGEIITELGENIDRLLVAGNDVNDLPMIEKAIAISDQVKSKVGILTIGNLLRQEIRDYSWAYQNVEFMNISSPDQAYHGYNDFFKQ